jgi:hypothetical protein
MVERSRLVWPPKVGERIHHDTGWPERSWSAEVRAVVDDRVAVVKRWRKHKGWFVYELVEKLDVEIWNERKDRDPETGYFNGPLPRSRSTEQES